MDGIKHGPPVLPEAWDFLPIFSTGRGAFSLKNCPALGAEHLIWSQVGALSGSPHIHRYYYHYYYSYLLKYMWRKE
jgi:hypothetical protein